MDRSTMTTSSPTSPDDTRLRVLYGDLALAPPARTPLRAGPLTLLYTDLGDLRTIRLGPHEIVRRLYHAVRAADWATIPAQITVTERTIGADTFRIAYMARHQDQEKGIDFQAHVTLTGDADGTLTYDFAGEALSTFARNRIGICVLHPAQDCRGLPCRVTHTAGDIEEGAFPDLIAPHQPFFDIAAISHAIGDTGATATITFAGDVFEMEDQRNWLDASYKTYSTPLALPMPVTVTPGTRIRQTVTLRLSNVPAELPARDAGPVIVEIGDASPHPLPQIGLMWPTAGRVSESVRFGSLADLLDHVRIDRSPSAPDWREALEEASDVAARASEDEQLVVGVRKPSDLPLPLPQTPSIARWILLPPDASVAKALRDSGAQSIGGGSDTNFTELNRNRPDTAVLDFLVFAGTPQVHAFDSLSIMETPPMLAEALRTAASFAGGKPILVGPLTLYGPRRPNDPRHGSLLGAAWYTAAFAYAACGGAESITFCHLSTGEIIPRPLRHVLESIAAGRPHVYQHLQTKASDELAVASFAFTYDGLEAGTSLTLVNLTPDEQTVLVRGLDADMAVVSILDETNAEEGFSNQRRVDSPDGQATLTLLPYAIADIMTTL